MAGGPVEAARLGISLRRGVELKSGGNTPGLGPKSSEGNSRQWSDSAPERDRSFLDLPRPR